MGTWVALFAVGATLLVPLSPARVPPVRRSRPPKVALDAPLADPIHPDALKITWDASVSEEAKSRGVAIESVTLEWACEPEGPWRRLGDAEVRNTDCYLWSPPNLEDTYLRLTVRDTEGNVSVAQTQNLFIGLRRIGAVRLHLNTPK
jgi:hypothetical protein